MDEESSAERNQKEAEELIAELCLACGDNTEFKVALHKYEYGCSIREIEKKLQQGPSSKIDVLRNLLTFLNSDVIHEEIPKLKSDIAHAIVCRIQNLLPENCGICKNRFCLKLNDEPFLPCSKCGQSSHKKCIIETTKSTVSINIDDLTHEQAYNILVNPHKLPGVHLLCQACEENHIPLEEPSSQSRPRADAITQECSIQNSTNLPHHNSPQTAESESETQIQDSTTSSDTTTQQQQVVEQDQNQPQRSRTPKKDITCRFFAKGSCRHGAKGENCEYNHPEVCQKFIQFGTRQPRGCNLAKACSRFHPRMCINSLRSSKCLDQQCRFRHTKGTARHETSADVSRNQQTRATGNQNLNQRYTQVTSPHVQRQQESHGQETNPHDTGHFLDAIRQMKAELLQAMRGELMMEMDNRLNTHMLHLRGTPHPIQQTPQQIPQQPSQAPHQQQSQPQAAPHNNLLPAPSQHHPTPRQYQQRQQMVPQQLHQQTPPQQMVTLSNQQQAHPTLMSQQAINQHNHTHQAIFPNDQRNRMGNVNPNPANNQ